MSPGVGVGWGLGVGEGYKVIFENYCLTRISWGTHVCVKYGHVLHAVINRKLIPRSKSKTKSIQKECFLIHG